MKISGLTIIRNALSNGYLVAEVLDTLAAVCDEVIVCDGYSDDGTVEYLKTRSDITLYQDRWDLVSNNGLEFANITNSGMKRCTGDYIFYLQADEIIHEKNIPFLRELINSGKFHSIVMDFCHIRYDFEHCLTTGYKKAVRVIKNLPSIHSDYDGYTFAGAINPQCDSGISCYHFGYVFLENILTKMINHSSYFYVDAPNYARRRDLATKFLEQIKKGVKLDPLELQKILEPEYTLAKHGLAIPKCVQHLQSAHKYKLPYTPALEHPRMNDYINSYLEEVAQIAKKIDKDSIIEFAKIVAQVKANEGRLFFVGVGGSAGNCSHAVNDFRKILGIESYTVVDNVSELTARINDEGWDTSFSEWLKGSRMNNKDALVVFSVGGGSSTTSFNIVTAINHAKAEGAKILSIVSRDGGHSKENSDACVLIPVVNEGRITPHAEEWQGVIWHLVVNMLAELCNED
jgi:D-sedoheptulose 7-phosphate isomerase